MAITYSEACMGLIGAGGAGNESSISPEFRAIFVKLTAGMELMASERNFLASPAEAVLLLSWRRGKPLSSAYLRKIKQLGRLRAATERPTRYRISSLMAVTFDPPGPKPH